MTCLYILKYVKYVFSKLRISFFLIAEEDLWVETFISVKNCVAESHYSNIIIVRINKYPDLSHGYTGKCIVYMFVHTWT